MRSEVSIPPEPGPPLRRLWYGFWRAFTRAAAIVFFDYRSYHGERVPRSGGVVLGSNHQSFLDPCLVGVALGRHLSYLARESLFRIPALGRLIRSLNAFPVARESQAPRQGIEISLKILAAGRALVLFPEGTRTATGRLGPMKRGVSLLARQSGCPVVPIYLDGAFHVWPRQRLLPRPGPIRVYFGEPIGFPQAPDLLRKEGYFEAAKGAAAKKDLQSGAPETTICSFSDTCSGNSGSPQPTTRSASPEAGRREPSFAAFLEALGEAYRALESEARKARQGARAGYWKPPAV
ncbi:MAG: 1-acyl-sn-glycerol-3-phosphate acyltransferase [Planctomycetes bacterium]|nr:1-acyl-sn-glycerol-3-phosphate acyltransferase [Planctomycetota bacterium]